MSRLRRWVFLSFSWVLIIPFAGGAVPAQAATTYQAIHVFPMPVGAGNLLQGADAALYGTTQSGGAAGFGTVFRLTFNGTTWAKSNIYIFAGGLDGQAPTGLIQGTDGALYGTTLGGTSGHGTIFRLALSGGVWTKTILHAFGGTNGSKPASGLIRGADGAYYGTTAEGGTTAAPGAGTLFKLALVSGTWMHSVLVNFAGGAEVTSPIALVQKAGAFYGLSAVGGAKGDGTLFQVALVGSTWTPTVLYSFDHVTPGAFRPVGLMLGADGALYTTTTAGGVSSAGVILKSTQAGSAWTTAVVHSFGAGTNGVRPEGPLFQDSDGTFYVTATQIAAAEHPAAVVQLSSTWGETIVHSFAGGTEGTSAGDRLIRGADGSLYGADDVVYRIAFDGASRSNKTDVVWQNTSGSVLAWFMNGTTVTKASTVYGALPGWTVRGSGDFDGDGQSDVLLQHAQGHIVVWLLNAGQIKTGVIVYGSPLPGWTVRGAGDFNGDGRADIVFQDGAGRIVVWFLYGTKVVGGATVYAQPLTGWTIRGAADFNGDKKADFLAQYADGTVVVWFMGNGALSGGAYIRQGPLPGYTVSGTGDLNNDGKADVLLQESTGRIAVWFLNGTTIKSGQYIYHNLLGTDWRIATSR